MSEADYYETHAVEFVAATVAVDMSALRHRFLATLPMPPTGATSALRILDAGAGLERDTHLLNDCGGLGRPDMWQTRDCRPEREAETWVNLLVKRR
ncbi:hypothetical protein [Paenirhodobacter hankyongi]|uniref:Class I SAM-dependent methyltransferase n=1 Tax=Paenirhodobacter hankyongi TaxID=2294033 RepID=A0A421BXM6_9RHOB|nr:hypothetical protein [Sinirhodobacter hankyongi]RLL73093.1 hypothetical protein DYS74_01905 [Sinirhodobacter hankyongi]